MSAEPRTEAIISEHRICGPVYEECYAKGHSPGEHCRADGMAWPCGVDRLVRALDAERKMAQATLAHRAKQNAGPQECDFHCVPDIAREYAALAKEDAR